MLSPLGLSDNGYFDDERFMRYLDYLKYWKQPEYARYLMFSLGWTISLTDIRSACTFWTNSRTRPFDT